MEKDYIMTSSMLCTNYYSCDQIKKTKMVRTYNTYGGQERCIQSSGGEI